MRSRAWVRGARKAPQPRRAEWCRAAHECGSQGKQAAHWTQLSSPFEGMRFRLQVNVLAYNLRPRPRRIDRWSLTSC